MVDYAQKVKLVQVFKNLTVKMRLKYLFHNYIRYIQSKTAVIAFGCGKVFWWGNLRERAHWQNPDVDRTII